jgi:hypothetical protein
MNDMQVLELFLASPEAIEDKIGDKTVIWKDILRVGEIPVTPGRKRKVPFKVTLDGPSSYNSDKIVVSMADLMSAHNGKAFESVTIPLRHPKPGDDEDVLNNSGYVEGLRIVKKNDNHYMQAALGFTEPDVAGKVRRGTIPNVSSGIFFNYHNKAQDKTFPVSLNHVCLTKTPIMDDLEPFKRVYASDDTLDAKDLKIEVINLDESSDDGDDGNDAKIVWNEQASTRWVISEIRAQLSPEQPEIEGVPSMPRPYYDVLDVSREDTALVEEWFKGDRKRWVIPFTVGENKVSIAPATRWTEVREAMVAASEDFEQCSYAALADKLDEQLHVMLGDDVGKTYKVDQITTDGRVSVVNTSDSSAYLAEYVAVGSCVLLSATSDWTRIREPAPPKPAPKKQIVSTDVSSPEGRVAVARQRRRQMLSR